MNIYVIAGHGAGDPGACAHGAQEAERVRALASRIKAYGGSSVTLHNFSDNAYASGALNYLNVGSNTGVVELHMDSAGAGARGAHVIIKAGFSPDGIDRALADKVGAILPGRSQRIVGRNNLANPKRAAARGINYRLLECGFISSIDDLSIFNSRIDDIARAICESFSVPVGSAPAPAPAPAPTGGIAVDGLWGKDTTRGLQRHFGTPVDGIVSSQSAVWRSKNPGLTFGWEWVSRPKGSKLIAAIQGAVGVPVDGLAGPTTFNGIIRHFKAESGAVVEDGKLDANSPTIKAMQRALNENRF